VNDGNSVENGVYGLEVVLGPVAETTDGAAFVAGVGSGVGHVEADAQTEPNDSSVFVCERACAAVMGQLEKVADRAGGVTKRIHAGYYNGVSQGPMVIQLQRFYSQARTARAGAGIVYGYRIEGKDRKRSTRVHQHHGGEVWSDAPGIGYGLGSLTDPLLPDEKEGEEDEIRIFGHFVGDIEVHVPWWFGFEEGSAVGDSAMGFDDDLFRLTVYELKDVGELDSEGYQTSTYDEFASGSLALPLIPYTIDGDRTTCGARR
jgi:hypothetical protein